ncbi:hypothetical protein B0J13DRAFT_591287 [Dactylonectria estremocensis]|uniref:Uncharacterized protein n=1 Tax=Dactylonectria estremocensis TaxID=1079267 RepID=A0A9P9I775_9HYPO|nr:hypothetical protein B0J13DRAFT_591287 [Dactylonectria estremocensis]
MCVPRDPTSPSPSLSPSVGSPAESDSSRSSNPRYTVEELVTIFLNFYTFLTTLHYDAADLKIPPPEGWPSLTPEVTRHLPYFDENSKARQLSLNVIDSEITECMIRADQLDAVDVKSYFNTLKKAYRSLKLIPCPGRITIEAWNIEDQAGEITEEQICAQTDNWKTDLYIQYLRQIYRQLGWPDAFRKDEATEVVNKLMDSIIEQHGDWEGSPQDWDSCRWK